jgi:hypothetical protein
LPPLSFQDLASLDITKLTPLSPEVISRQATINIGKREERRREGGEWPRPCRPAEAAATATGSRGRATAVAERAVSARPPPPFCSSLPI